MIEELYLRITEGRVKVKISSQNFSPLRVALVKKHATWVAVGLTTGSLCADYDVASSVATFWIGERRRKQSRISYEIIDETLSTDPAPTGD